MTDDLSHGAEPFFVLHHDAHSGSGDALMKVWQLAFEPVFDGARTASIIAGVLADLGVTSFAIYELLGPHDIMVTAWLPRAVDADEFEEMVRIAFSRHFLRVSDIELNHVGAVLRHWAWSDPGSIAMRSPSENTLSLLQDTDYVRRLNGTLMGDESGQRLTEEETSAAIRESLIAPYVEGSVPEERLRFAMFIRSGRLKSDYRRQFKASLVKRIAELTGVVDDEGGHLANEIALFDTPRGQSGEFLALGSLRASFFYRGLAGLIEFVLRDDYRSSFRIRPVTYVLARPGFTLYSDGLSDAASVAEDVADVSVDELLEAEESTHFECKATVYADVNRWLHGGGDELHSNEQLFTEGIARTVTAFLNTPKSVGRLLVGALEAGPLERSIAGGKNEGHILGKLDRLHRTGGYWLTGIEMDLELVDGKRGLGDADSLGRHVLERLESMISGPSLAGRIDLAFERHGDRTLMLLTVNPSAPRAWAYCTLPETREVIFPVRVGARSKSLSRSEEAEYREQFAE